MPSQKSTRSKEDTWTPDELNRALKDDPRRNRDDDRKRDRVNGEGKHRRRRDEESEQKRHRDDDDRRRHHGDDRRSKHRDKDEDSRPTVSLTEDERERQRRERREQREKKDGRDRRDKNAIEFKNKREKKAYDVEVDDNDEGEERRQHRQHEDHDRDRHHRDEDQDRRHRSREGEGEDERERLRRERREKRERRPGETEGKDRRNRHEQNRRGDTGDRESDKDRINRHQDADERHRSRDARESDRSKSHRSDRDRDREREDRRKEREEKPREKEKEDLHRSSRHSEKKVEEAKKKEEDEYEYEEDFEDYEEDFEEEEEDNNINNIQDSEVSDVLRALDAENDRLLSGRSPQVSANYERRRQAHDGSDEEDDYRHDRNVEARTEKPRATINFVSAKQRAISKKTASKTTQRARDLLSMIELDVATFDLLDLPPVKEYDLYIRAFGRSDTRQAYVQTNDDNIDRDIQTEEIDYRQKWTQHPPEDFKGYGRGDGEKDYEEEEEESQLKHNQEADTGRLNTFLEKAGQVIAILLEEQREEEQSHGDRTQSHINISEGYTQLDLLPILEGRHVEFAHFSPTQPNLLLTVYSQCPTVSADNPVSKRGIICVWNSNEPNYPQKILACGSQPKCCCFSPVKPSLVFAGMVDGSIAMWDLREATSLHRSTAVFDQQYSLRYPTYDTAGVLENENHHSPVMSILPIYSYINSDAYKDTTTAAMEGTDESSSGLSFQLVSTEENAILNFWVVAEIVAPDVAGSPSDLGLAPGGLVKLLKSSSLVLENPTRDMRLKTGLRAVDMKLLPSDPNQFYVGTDSGFVLHGVRFGTRAYPRLHNPVIESIVEVTSVDFSPFEQPCFLAGCADGSFSLYHTKSENPLVMWSTVTRGRPVQCVRWSRSRPCVFYVLDEASTLHIFDLLEGDSSPKQVEQISKHRVVSFCMTNDYKASGLGTPGKHPQMLFGLASGETEIHTVTRELREPQDLELEFLASYLQRF